MPEYPEASIVCHLDLERRSHVPTLPWSVLLAAHLAEYRFRPAANALLSDMGAGKSLAAHLPPLTNPKYAFKRAQRKGKWIDYKRMMDHLLNKWGFRHFHCANDSILVFVHLCEWTGVARVLDFIPHDGNWCIEKRLVEIVVRNWPDSGIARSFGEGPSRMTEEDLFDARKQGLNMPVNVDGTYFLPPNGALMSDGSAYGSGQFVPIGVVGKRYVRGAAPDKWIDNHQMLIIAVDPDDARSPWEMAAAQGGLLASGRLRRSATEVRARGDLLSPVRDTRSSDP